MHRAPAQRADLVRGFLALRGIVEMAERDVGAFRGEGECSRPTDPP